jgi:hypothetical protein
MPSAHLSLSHKRRAFGPVGPVFEIMMCAAELPFPAASSTVADVGWKRKSSSSAPVPVTAGPSAHHQEAQMITYCRGALSRQQPMCMVGRKAHVLDAAQWIKTALIAILCMGKRRQAWSSGRATHYFRQIRTF